MEFRKVLTERLSRKKGLWVPLFYVLILLPLFFLHDTFEEWDGVMQFFAGRGIFSGLGYQGWASHFWPPLYAFLIGLFNIILPGFEAAKLVSVIASVILLCVVYGFAMEVFHDHKAGLLSQVFLIVNPLFVQSSFQAENHMLDSMFFVSGLLVFLKALEKPTTKMFLFTGILVGLAGLTRYTSYALMPAIVISLVWFQGRKQAIRSFFMIALGFVLVSSPWWIYNAVQNGSPLHTWQYMNIGLRVIPQVEKNEWWWHVQANYSSVFDIISTLPKEYIRNVFYNLLRSGILVNNSVGVLFPFTIISIIVVSRKVIIRQFFVLAGTLIIYMSLVSQAFVFPEVFLSWAVILTIFIVAFLEDIGQLSQKKYPALEKIRFSYWLCGFFIVMGLGNTILRSNEYINDKTDEGQLGDYVLVTQAIKAHDPDIESKFVMAIHPARAYYLNSKYMMVPLFFEGSLDELVSYDGLSERVIEYAPKAHSLSTEPDFIADYLIYDLGVKEYLPQFSYLLDASTVQIPRHFNLVYRSDEVVVYEIIRDER